MGDDARAPEEVARDLEVPLAAVLEAIDYCNRNQDLLKKELEEELAVLREYDKRQRPLMPPDDLPDS